MRPVGADVERGDNGTRTTSTYDGANQLVYSAALAGRTTYTFDSSGNQRVVQEPSGNRTTTVWDYENQPTVYQYPAGSRTTMLYNGDNQRVQKKTGSAASGLFNFIWDGQNILAEGNAFDGINVPFTYEPNQFGNLISSNHGGATAYYHFDALGSTRQLTDSSQLVTDTWLYDAWGNTLVRTGTTAAFFQWVGELGYYYDTEMGLFAVRRRPYGPVIGRWTTVDPLHLFAALLVLPNLSSPNAYEYCNSRPVTYQDPSGELPPGVLGALQGLLVGCGIGGLFSVVVGLQVGGMAAPLPSHFCNAATGCLMGMCLEVAAASQAMTGGLFLPPAWIACSGVSRLYCSYCQAQMRCPPVFPPPPGIPLWVWNAFRSMWPLC